MQKYNENFLKEIKALGERVLQCEPMSKHTTFKIGGPADFFVTIDKEDNLEKILALCKNKEIPIHIIGNGSNLLVSDKGVRGVVLKLGKEFKGVKILEYRKDMTIVKCGAGALNSTFCNFLKNKGLSGAEFLYGIPGTIGGSVRMNAGAHGKEIKDITLNSYSVGDEGNIRALSKNQMNFQYRTSCFSESKDIVTAVVFCFSVSETSKVDSNMKEYLEKRKRNQPLSFPNAGSIFKRPEGKFASKLIDECGLKGMKVGDAMVSEKHAGFIVNCGNATSKDVLTLIQKIKDVVFEKKKIKLEEEVEIWN